MDKNRTISRLNTHDGAAINFAPGPEYEYVTGDRVADPENNNLTTLAHASPQLVPLELGQRHYQNLG